MKNFKSNHFSKNKNIIFKLIILLVFITHNTYLHSQTFDIYYNLKYPSSYQESSIPHDSILFPESLLTNRIETNFNRALLSYYTYSIPHSHEYDYQDHLQRNIFLLELYDFDPISVLNNSANPLNIVFHPTERASYNFDVEANNYSHGIDFLGNLLKPETRWGGIQKNLPVNFYELDQYNYLGFWLMDPFINNPDAKGGDMYLIFGYISEDIYKDGYLANEVKICPQHFCSFDTTAFGKIGRDTNNENTFSFSSNTSYSAMQNVGFDGLNDDEEREFFASYLNRIEEKFGIHSPAYINAYNDPSADNYIRPYDNLFKNTSIHDKFKYSQHSQGNSYRPDYEDLNKNGVFDTLNHYYQIKLSLRPEDLKEGDQFIVEKKTVRISLIEEPVSYYKFLIPLDPQNWQEVGSGYDEIKTDFFRLFLTGFDETVILRFPEIAIVADDLDFNNIFKIEETVNLYPNPCSGDYVKVLITNGNLVQIELFNELGQLIMTKQATDKGMYLNTEGLNNGFYFVRIETTKDIYVKKLMIARQ